MMNGITALPLSHTEDVLAVSFHLWNLQDDPSASGWFLAFVDIKCDGTLVLVSSKDTSNQPDGPPCKCCARFQDEVYLWIVQSGMFSQYTVCMWKGWGCGVSGVAHKWQLSSVPVSLLAENYKHVCRGVLSFDRVFYGILTVNPV